MEIPVNLGWYQELRGGRLLGIGRVDESVFIFPIVVRGGEIHEVVISYFNWYLLAGIVSVCDAHRHNKTVAHLFYSSSRWAKLDQLYFYTLRSIPFMLMLHCCCFYFCFCAVSTRFHDMPLHSNLMTTFESLWVIRRQVMKFESSLRVHYHYGRRCQLYEP